MNLLRSRIVEDSPDVLLGQTLDGRYEIVDVAGRGGIGVVYRARQPAAGGRWVAVKVLSPAAANVGSSAPRFENEAKIIASLKHPNTIKLFDTGRTEDGRLYIVTEYLDGETLMDRVQRGALGQLETAQVLLQVARSLGEAHERAIVHRDLKPANIFVERVGTQEVVKVLDFGIAKLVQNQKLTAPMQVFGTPGYMSPEQCRGEVVDGRADLFALGVVGFLCLTRRLPFYSLTADSLVFEAMAQPCQRLADDHERELEPELMACIDELTAFDPTDRIPSAATAADMLENVIKVIDSTVGVMLPGSKSPAESPLHVPPHPPAAALRDPSKSFDDDAPFSTTSDVRDTVTAPSRPHDTNVETELATRTVAATSSTHRDVLMAIGVAVVAAVVVVLVLMAT